MRRPRQKIVIDPMSITPSDIAHGKDSIVPSHPHRKLPERKGANLREETPQSPLALEEGSHEGQKDIIKAEIDNKEKLEELLEKTERVILKISNVIPIFTSDVVIDTAKVSVIYRPFLFSERIHSIPVEDVTDVYIETAPFFATLNIVDVGFVENLVQVKWLWKKDAERARRVIAGIMQAKKEEIDLKRIEDKDIASKLEEIGKVREAQTTVTNA
jgi:hypothetical protein